MKMKIISTNQHEIFCNQSLSLTDALNEGKLVKDLHKGKIQF